MKYGCGTTIDNYSILQALGFDYIELPGNQISLAHIIGGPQPIIYQKLGLPHIYFSGSFSL